MPIYIVTSGEYSDYHIDGVFDNKEEANLLAKRVDGFVDEWIPNARRDWILRDAWRCIMYVQDGRIADYNSGQCSYGELADPNAKIRSRRHEFYFDGKTDWVIVDSYISYEHAVKLAVEARQAILRERAINPDFHLPEFEYEDADGNWIKN